MRKRASRSKAGLLVSLCATISSTCAPTTTPGQATQAVTNGRTSRSDPAVVLVLNTRSLCSGTLIAPRVVLTAAHCIPSAREEAVRVFFGTELGGDGTTVRVIHALRHPAAANFSYVHDLALLLLERPAPESATPIPLLPSALVAAILEQEGRVVGFGRRQEDGAAGVKAEGTVLISRITEFIIHSRPSPSLTCNGDSGGPLFATVDGVEYLAGVTSTGLEGCEGRATSARVDAYAASFIVPYLTAVEPGAAGIGARCYYPENCGTGACTPSLGVPWIRYCTRACSAASDCPAGMQCHGDGLCRHPVAMPEVLGISCNASRMCETQLCGRAQGAPASVCTAACDPTRQNACPEGLVCLPSADSPAQHICVPPAPPQGCAAVPGATGAGLAWMVLLVGVAVRRRRPSRL